MLKAAVNMGGIRSEVLVDRKMRPWPVRETATSLINILQVRSDNETVVQSTSPAIPSVVV